MQALIDFIMQWIHLFEILVAFLIAIIGFSIIGWKDSNRTTPRFIIGLMFAVLALFITMHAFEPNNLTGIFTAIGTLALAFVTFLSVMEGRNLRRQYQERENRDRNERQLYMIIEWAIDVAKCGSEQGTPNIRSGKFDDKTWSFIDKQAEKFEIVFEPLYTKSIFMREAAKMIDIELGDSATKVSVYLIMQRESLRKYREWNLQRDSLVIHDRDTYLATLAKELADTNRHLQDWATKIAEQAGKVNLGK